MTTTVQQVGYAIDTPSSDGSIPPPPPPKSTASSASSSEPLLNEQQITTIATSLDNVNDDGSDNEVEIEADEIDASGSTKKIIIKN